MKKIFTGLAIVGAIAIAYASTSSNGFTARDHWMFTNFEACFALAYLGLAMDGIQTQLQSIRLLLPNSGASVRNESVSAILDELRTLNRHLESAAKVAEFQHDQTTERVRSLTEQLSWIQIHVAPQKTFGL